VTGRYVTNFGFVTVDQYSILFGNALFQGGVKGTLEIRLTRIGRGDLSD